MTPYWKECKIGHAMSLVIIDPHDSAVRFDQPGPLHGLHTSFKHSDTKTEGLGQGAHSFCPFESTLSRSLFLSAGKWPQKKLQTHWSLARIRTFVFLLSLLSAKRGQKSLAEVVNLFILLLLSASGIKLVLRRQAPPFFWSYSRRTDLFCFFGGK